MPVITFCEAIRQAYREEMRRDGNVFLMGEDVGRWGSLYRSSAGLLEEFGPAQVKDAPISEAAICGTAVGAAMIGLRPVVELMADLNDNISRQIKVLDLKTQPTIYIKGSVRKV